MRLAWIRPAGLVRLGAVLCVALSLFGAPTARAEVDEAGRLARLASRVEIVRDEWGVPHITGERDADAVFGMMYAQAEDDFNRIETNYLVALGRLAEAEGEAALYQDLRARMYLDHDALKALYSRSPGWLRTLMKAWADGLNYYLLVHPEVRPRVIERFEPWMALSFTEGSIGGDIEDISLEDLKAFYEGDLSPPRRQVAEVYVEPTGSNGIALAPSMSRTGEALLLINPHTSFFFRSEQQVTSRQGLNVYGAATWGQFFIYQGFNETAGWMHTSSGVDVVDEFIEAVSEQSGRLVYRHRASLKPVRVSPVTLAYRRADGEMGYRTFQVFRTHHGPVVKRTDGGWVSTALMVRPIEALSQSYLRTRARDLSGFIRASRFAANSSNNTVFADAKGSIAYLHPQFIPRRTDALDYTRPVNGADPAADWKGIHPLRETPHVLNPPGGWIQNTNNWPYSAAGAASPKREAFPRYMDTAGETPRGRHALRLLEGATPFSLEGLVEAAYDPYLPAFADLTPSLLAAFDALPAEDPRRRALADPIEAIRTWPHTWSLDSVPTSLGVFWGEILWAAAAAPSGEAGVSVYEGMLSLVSSDRKLAAFAEAVARLERDFGNWRTPWGEINRFQRLTGAIEPRFSDDEPSLPVPFTSSQWGSLAAFGARSYPGTRRYYGTRGNSFVAAVAFGERVRAVAVSAGGGSGDPASAHFMDQAALYAAGQLREVHFHPDQVRAHARVRYRPGERPIP
jgi:acyl-homoserine-lactone acylase